jgi:hypothetical protein
MYFVVHEYKHGATQRLFIVTQIVFVMEYATDCNTEGFYCGNLGAKDTSK